MVTDAPRLSDRDRRELSRLAATGWYGKPVRKGSTLIAARPGGQGQPLFGVGLYKLTPHLPADLPFYVFQLYGARTQNPENFIQSLAAHCVEEIRSVQAHGPYLLGGSCFSGWVAYEIAQQLRAEGETVSLLMLVERSGDGRFYDFCEPIIRPIARNCLELSRMGSHGERFRHVADKASFKLFGRSPFSDRSRTGTAKRDLQPVHSASSSPIMERWGAIHRKALASYTPSPYTGATALFFARWGGRRSFLFPMGGMRKMLRGPVDVKVFPGGHWLEDDRDLRVLGDQMGRAIARSRQITDRAAIAG